MCVCMSFFPFFFLNVIVVQVQLSSFFPHYSPLPPLPDLPPSILPPLALYMGPLYMFLNNPSPSFPIISISHLLWLLSGEGGGQQCVVASPVSPTGDLACNRGICPDWESLAIFWFAGQYSGH